MSLISKLEQLNIFFIIKTYFTLKLFHTAAEEPAIAMPFVLFLANTLKRGKLSLTVLVAQRQGTTVLLLTVTEKEKLKKKKGNQWE